ncbi:hypothetical protein AB8A20_07935 [Tardiphaga sp. 604_B6_N1_1]|uniref:hypothetical protein n=1 Tax=unclassified Tardiphaga TaxID=2631404 RepID=UPI003F261627
MDLDQQRFMALEGIHTWANAVIIQVARIEQVRAVSFGHGDDRYAARRQFIAERHLFLIAANKLLEHCSWARKLDFICADAFAVFDPIADNIKLMRNHNEHEIEYFTERGRHPKTWVTVTDQGSADASSTVGDRIGNLLSWNDVAAAAKSILAAIPEHYWPPLPKGESI